MFIRSQNARTLSKADGENLRQTHDVKSRNNCTASQPRSVQDFALNCAGCSDAVFNASLHSKIVAVDLQRSLVALEFVV